MSHFAEKERDEDTKNEWPCLMPTKKRVWQNFAPARKSFKRLKLLFYPSDYACTTLGQYAACESKAERVKNVPGTVRKPWTL